MRFVIAAVLMMPFVSFSDDLLRVFLIEGKELRATCVAEKIQLNKEDVHKETGDVVVPIRCKGPITVRKEGTSKALNKLKLK